jgi:hypothetical protein
MRVEGWRSGTLCVEDTEQKSSESGFVLVETMMAGLRGRLGRKDVMLLISLLERSSCGY